MKKLSLTFGLGLLYAFSMPFIIDAQIPKPTDQAKHTVAPPIHSTAGVVASAWSKDHVKFPRGLTKTPRYKLAAAKRFDRSGFGIPAQVVMLPKQLSMWGNSQYGDCVSASEAARKAAYSVYCGLPETFIPENTVIAWASKYGYRDGANLTDVMDTAQVNGMTASDGKVYLDGPYSSVNFTDEASLQAALGVGPVNLGLDANALPSGAGNTQGWFAFGGRPGQFNNEDHCTALFGYGKTADLAAAISQTYGVTVTLPPNAPATGYLHFTWSTIGIVDHAWLMSTVGEAWVQHPNTVGQSPTPPVPPAPPVPPGPSPAPGNVTITLTTSQVSDVLKQAGGTSPGTSGTFTVGANGVITLTPTSGKIAGPSTAYERLQAKYAAEGSKLTFDAWLKANYPPEYVADVAVEQSKRRAPVADSVDLSDIRRRQDLQQRMLEKIFDNLGIPKDK